MLYGIKWLLNISFIDIMYLYVCYIMHDLYEFSQSGEQAFLQVRSLQMACRRLYIYHSYSRKLSDRVEHHLSYLWIFLWLLGTFWSLRNHLYTPKHQKKLFLLAENGYPGQRIARYRARKLSQLERCMGLHVLRTFFTVSVISEPSDGFCEL